MEFIKNQTNALNKIFEFFLFPLLNKIYSNNSENPTFKLSYSNQNKNIKSHTDYSNLILKLNSNESIKEILEKHIYLIIKIYQKYFPWEGINISVDKKIQLSEKAFIKFCKDFDIHPYLISLIKINEIYTNSLLNNKIIFSVTETLLDNIKNQGGYFTFYHLIVCLYLISLQSFVNKKDKKSSYGFYNKNTFNANEEEKDQKLSDCINNDLDYNEDMDKRKETGFKFDDFVEGKDISKKFYY